MSENDLKYADIVQVESVTFATYANEYLKLGWVLLEVQGTQFTLGWPRVQGEVKIPEKRNPMDMVATGPAPF